jgi:hypothetical protein
MDRPADILEAEVTPVFTPVTSTETEVDMSSSVNRYVL